MSSDLENIFTSKEVALLASVSMLSLYDFITYFPYGIETIDPLKGNVNFLENNKIFIFNGTLKAIDHRKGKRNFLILTFFDQGQFIKVYSFNSAKYLLSLFRLNENFQMLLKFSGGFWNLLKIARKHDHEQIQPFILGKMALKQYLQPKYLKNGQITSAKFNQLHRKLQPSHYELNLNGLVPENDLFPQNLNLLKVHKPQTLNDFYSSLKNFTMLRLFLFLAITKYANTTLEKKEALAGQMDIDFIKNISASLPFSLSQSQKLTIWEILKEITNYED